MIMKKTSILFVLVLTVLISFTVISQVKLSKETVIEKKLPVKKEYQQQPVTLKVPNQENLTGTWYWQSSDAKNNIELYLEQNGNSAQGKHCSSFLEGKKLDCTNDGDENSVILHMVANNVFEGTLKSGFSDAIINIRVTLNPADETIQFQQLSHPAEEYYLPENATLTLAQD